MKPYILAHNCVKTILVSPQKRKGDCSSTPCVTNNIKTDTLHCKQSSCIRRAKHPRHLLPQTHIYFRPNNNNLPNPILNPNNLTSHQNIRPHHTDPARPRHHDHHRGSLPFPLPPETMPFVKYTAPQMVTAHQASHAMLAEVRTLDKAFPLIPAMLALKLRVSCRICGYC